MEISDHEMKMFSLQQQVRQNQSELEDFVKEMTSWEEEVKKKETDIMKQKPEKPMVWKPYVILNKIYNIQTVIQR